MLDDTTTTAINDTIAPTVTLFPEEDNSTGNTLFPDDEEGGYNPSGYVFIATLIAFFLVIAIIAACVVIIKNRRLDRLRHHLMPLYNFDPAEEGEDWEVELLDEGPENRPLHKGYKSMDYPPTENTDLFRR